MVFSNKWVVLLSSFMSRFLTFGICFGLGVLTEEFQRIYDLDKFSASLLVSITTGTVLGAAPFGTFLINYFSIRTAHVLGSVLFVSGLFLAAYADSYALTCMCVGVISGLGAAVIIFLTKNIAKISTNYIFSIKIFK